MPRCPLCESVQAIGDVCDVCGRPFPASEAAPVPVTPLPGLEVTRFAPTGDVAVERLPELEVTGEEGELDVTLGPVEGFSPTAAAPVTVDVEPLDIDRVIDGAVLEPAWAPRPLVCRYCLTPATSGERLCARCGMRLPLDRLSAAAAEDEHRKCGDCGVPMTGTQCPACGARAGIGP